MWTREKNEDPSNPSNPPSPADSTRNVISREFGDSSPAPSPCHAQRNPQGAVGKSIVIRGELTGNEDLTIEGTVEGKIDLMDHNLTIGASGHIEAEVGAKKVLVEGEVKGNINAGERVELCATGRVTGDISAPRVIIADGAQFKGMVNMSEKHAAAQTPADTQIA